MERETERERERERGGERKRESLGTECGIALFSPRLDERAKML